MNYINITTDDLQELKNLRDFIEKELEQHGTEESFYQKLQEDLWDLNDKINRLDNESTE